MQCINQFFRLRKNFGLVGQSYLEQVVEYFLTETRLKIVEPVDHGFSPAVRHKKNDHY